MTGNESTDIQFGEIERSSPATALRPDQDAHFAIRAIGNPTDADMPIFVDLDVMRDMEAHSISNTNVELGGVMLGRQLTDSNGQPFVVVSESLRAKHYEATRGSFKFTHDTWSQISSDRRQFHPDLEMVGWYHTHPGWTVFLSPMDLFICNNFFNGSQNVALVIDPCNDDRGWFQWEETKVQPDNKASPKASHTATKNPPRRTGGFCLFANRHRSTSLDYFAGIYNKEPKMNVDQRYTDDGLPNTKYSIGGAQTTNGMPVMMVDSRSAKSDSALWMILGAQFLLILFLAWSTRAPAAGDGAVANLANGQQAISVAELQTSNQIYRDILNTVVTDQDGVSGLAENYTTLQLEQKRMTANLDGQIARVDALLQQKETLEAESESLTQDNLALQRLAEENEQQIVALQQRGDQLLAAQSGENISGFDPLWTTLIAGGGGLVGVLAGFFGARWAKEESYRTEPEIESRQNAFEEALPIES